MQSLPSLEQQAFLEFDARCSLAVTYSVAQSALIRFHSVSSNAMIYNPRAGRVIDGHQISFQSAGRIISMTEHVAMNELKLVDPVIAVRFRVFCLAAPALIEFVH